MSISYQPRIDGLRFVAIFMVLAEHIVHSLAKHFSAGFYGVNLFFVISGFLITSILISNTDQPYKKSYKTFFIRRALRIFPAYFLVVLIYYLIGKDGIREDLPYLLTYTYNYRIVNSSAPIVAHTFFWSLSVEEQFYIFFPLIVLAFRKNINILIIIFTVILIMSYSQIFLDIFNLKRYNYVGIVSNMAPLTLGAFGAILRKYRIQNCSFFHNIFIEILIFSFLLLVLYRCNLEYKLLFSSLCNFYLVLKSSYFEFKVSFINKFLSNSFILYVGKISYGIYLYQGIVMLIVGRFFLIPFLELIPFKSFGYFSFIEEFDWVFRFIVLSVSTILVASVSYKYFELPFLKLKDKYFKL